MNLHGPVRAPKNAGAGTAMVTISFDAWKEGKVAPTTHALAARATKVAGKSEPVSTALVATLVQPDREAVVWKVGFSADGKRLWTAGYPSGVVQFWDVEQRKELRKVESPRGYRGSADYAHLAPDWGTLYVPVQSRKVKTTEKDGKKHYRFEYGGEVRVWDLKTGKTRPPVKPAEGHAPAQAKLSPDGKHLLVHEQPSFDRDESKPEVLVLVTLATGARRVLWTGHARGVFSPDGKAVAVSTTEDQSAKSTVRVIDTATGKERAKLECPDKQRLFSVTGFLAGGRLLAVDLGGKRGADREVWFLDARTLQRRGRYTGKGDAEGKGWSGGGPLGDGKRYFVFSPAGVEVVEVPTGKVVRTVKANWPRQPWQWAVSADGRYLAAGWMPKVDAERESDRDPDPRDLPQPRLSLIDLKEDAPTRVLVAPHGFIGGVAFRPGGKALAFGGCGAVYLFDLTKK